MSASPDPRAPAAPGAAAADLIPGYRLHEILGRGGMGTVYKARQLGLDRWVAVKILSSELSGDPDYVGRFLQEARTAGKLRHENIVGALDCGESQGRHFMVMEYVEGRPLEAVLKERGSLPEREALDLARQVADGLQYAWGHGIIHRDIKPQNILVTPQGVARICDLGLCRDVTRSARMTLTGTITCTPAYASPEQAHGEKQLDTRTDIYSLGVTLYQLLTGELPFAGDAPGDLLIKHATELPPPPVLKNPILSPAANRLVLQMLEKARDRRPETPGAVSARIREILAGDARVPVAAPRPGTARTATRAAPSPPSRTRADRWMALLAVLAIPVLLATLAGHGVLYLLQRTPAPPLPPPEPAGPPRAVGRDAYVAQALSQARALHQRKKWYAALAKLEDVLDADPGNAEALFLKRRVEAERVEWEVRTALEEAAEAAEQRDWERLAKAAETVLTFRPENPQAREWKDLADRERRYVGAMKRAEACLAAGRLSDARAAAEEALGVKLGDPAARDLLARIDAAERGRR